MSLVALTLSVALAAGPAAHVEGELCPEAKNLPLLTIDRVQDPALPVVDQWQVFWGTMPVSDYQLAELSGEDTFIDRTRAEMVSRPSWVYLGTLVSAVGMAVSSFGWVLYGQGKQHVSVSLPLAIGGIVMGAGGMLVITESVQTPLEPLIAPTPVHRMTRDEVRGIVARVNQKLYKDICKAALSAHDVEARRDDSSP
jgi:hypothetical protein